MGRVVQPAGEHTCIVIRPLASAEVEGTAWLEPFVADFRVRLMALLPSAFKCAFSFVRRRAIHSSIQKL